MPGIANFIKNFLNKMVYNQKQIIGKGRKLLKNTIDINNTVYNIKDNNLIKELKFICKEMEIEKELLSSTKKN